ncbi:MULTISPECIES: hypothetical protein [Roseomonadaceae]|nr:hypothetical protein [Roseomonas oleicola]
MSSPTATRVACRRLSGEPGEARLVNAMPVPRVQANGADMPEALD